MLPARPLPFRLALALLFAAALGVRLFGLDWDQGHMYHPDERRIVQADPGCIPGWVEETLRYDTSSQLLARYTTEDVPLHGTVIPAESQVVLLAGSANRDPRAFDDPDEYRVLRFGADGAASQGKLASFGVGRHFCMGASLARLEARVALEELLGAVRGWEIDEAGATRVHSVSVRGFATLPTEVEAR